MQKTKFWIGKKEIQGWGIVQRECLPALYEALDSIQSTEKKNVPVFVCVIQPYDLDQDI